MAQIIFVENSPLGRDESRWSRDLGTNRQDSPAAVMDELQATVAAWAGLKVITQYDSVTGSWFFIALHDATLGNLVGGCRLATYPRPADGLRDAMRLAEGMTQKWAVIRYPFGGGKSVIAVPHALQDIEREGLLERFGLMIENLGGQYSTGEDFGTSHDDMLLLARVTQYVHGVDPVGGFSNDSGRYTALGVFAGIKAAVRHKYGDDDLCGRKVVVQGVGHVGQALTRELAKAGATILISERDESRALKVAAELGCETVDPGAIYKVTCDVYSPCALGGSIDRDSVMDLDCKIVAGAANNQLREAAVADVLHERGILYAPDFVINAGAAIALPMFQRESTEAQVLSRIRGIAETLTTIFNEASELDESPLHAAQRIAERVLAKARAKYPSS